MQHGKKFSTSKKKENGVNTTITIPGKSLSAYPQMMCDRFVSLESSVKPLKTLA